MNKLLTALVTLFRRKPIVKFEGVDFRALTSQAFAEVLDNAADEAKFEFRDCYLSTGPLPWPHANFEFRNCRIG